jgi:hypothetical protein
MMFPAPHMDCCVTRRGKLQENLLISLQSLSVRAQLCDVHVAVMNTHDVLASVSWDQCPGISVLGSMSWDQCPGISVLGSVSWDQCPGISVLGSVSWDAESLNAIHIVVVPK